jgi:hypothetical protein
MKCPCHRRAEQSLAADGAIACFSSNLVPSACLLIARRSWRQALGVWILSASENQAGWWNLSDGRDLIESPDRKHQAILKYVGEIRFGPHYFSLTVDSFSFGERIFGDDYLWSDDSRFFAVQEWKTTDYATGPITKLLLIEDIERRECPLSGINGWIVPKQFEGSKLIYTKRYYDEGLDKIAEFEIEFLGLDRWGPL